MFACQVGSGLKSCSHVCKVTLQDVSRSHSSFRRLLNTSTHEPCLVKHSSFLCRSQYWLLSKDFLSSTCKSSSANSGMQVVSCPGRSITNRCSESSNRQCTERLMIHGRDFPFPFICYTPDIFREWGIFLYSPYRRRMRLLPPGISIQHAYSRTQIRAPPHILVYVGMRYCCQQVVDQPVQPHCLTTSPRKGVLMAE